MLQASTAKATAGNSFFGLAIGFTVTAMAIAVGPISGGALNPALGMTAVVGALNAGAGLSAHRFFAMCLVYNSACPLGGVLAALVFRVTNQHDFDHTSPTSEAKPDEVARPHPTQRCNSSGTFAGE